MRCSMTVTPIHGIVATSSEEESVTYVVRISVTYVPERVTSRRRCRCDDFLDSLALTFVEFTQAGLQYVGELGSITGVDGL